MTPGEAAWVREHVFTVQMRHEYAETPGFYEACACQYGTTTWCQIGRHDRCHRAEPLAGYETTIRWRGGMTSAFFPEPFEHPTPSATRAFRERDALVWLADRTCRWVCPCDCHTAPAAPEQLDLFAAAVT